MDIILLDGFRTLFIEDGVATDAISGEQYTTEQLEALAQYDFEQE